MSEERAENGAARLDPEIARKVDQMRAQLGEGFGKVVLAMMAQSRYRHQSIADLQHLVLDPLMNDRIAIAYPGKKDGDQAQEITGLAIRASVSEEVDAKIRDRIKSRTWPIRLKPKEWVSGEINWLFDVIAADQKGAVVVLANFKQVAKQGTLRLHPIISRLIEPEILEKLGARGADTNIPERTVQ